LGQGTLTEVEGSVPLASVYYLVYIPSFSIEYFIYLFYKTS